MHTCINALVTHMKIGLTDTFNTIKPYGGEVQSAGKDAAKLFNLCPALMPVYVDGSVYDDLIYDLIVITKTRSHEKKTNLMNNLEAAETTINWLLDHTNFPAPGRGTYVIKTGQGHLKATVLLCDHNVTIIAIRLNIADHTI
jgi:hypothetical protein